MKYFNVGAIKMRLFYKQKIFFVFMISLMFILCSCKKNNKYGKSDVNESNLNIKDNIEMKTVLSKEKILEIAQKILKKEQKKDFARYQIIYDVNNLIWKDHLSRLEEEAINKINSILEDHEYQVVYCTDTNAMGGDYLILIDPYTGELIKAFPTL